MYTVVLMAAMTSGSAAPDWHRHGCHGGVAVYSGSCFGCYGGAYSYTGGVGLPYGGSCIGTDGGYHVAGPNPSYGCWGYWGSNTNLTVYSAPGNYGYGNGGGLPGFGVSFQCNGCYGCYGGWACFGSPVLPVVPLYGEGGTGPIVPQAPNANPAPPAPAPTPAPAPKGKEESRIRSKVIIEVPENAKLYVDDNLMAAGPKQRVFQTPLLDADETYYYEVRVEVTKNGKVTTSDTQRLIIRPGVTVTADFRDPARPDIITASESRR